MSTPTRHSLRLSSRASLPSSPATPSESLHLLELEPSSIDASPRRSKRRRVDSDVALIDLEDTVFSATLPVTPSKRKASPSKRDIKPKSVSPKKPKLVSRPLSTPHPTPAQWKETYDLIKAMRSTIIAPVDTKGCQLAKEKETEPKSKRLATLVSLILASSARDEVVDPAVSRLQEVLGGSITLDALLSASANIVEDAIKPVGIQKKKTEQLQQTARMLKDQFDSDVPQTVTELVSLPGVGPKVAMLTLQFAWNINVGIGVDTHIHRITNRLGWNVPSTNKTEDTRLNVESWLPNELWGDINSTFVGFGQTICLDRSPKCDQCTVGLTGLCPSAQTPQKKVSSTPRAKNKVVKAGTGSPKAEIIVELDLEKKSVNWPAE